MRSPPDPHTRAHCDDSDSPPEESRTEERVRGIEAARKSKNQRTYQDAYATCHDPPYPACGPVRHIRHGETSIPLQSKSLRCLLAIPVGSTRFAGRCPRRRSTTSSRPTVKLAKRPPTRRTEELSKSALRLASMG